MKTIKYMGGLHPLKTVGEGEDSSPERDVYNGWDEGESFNVEPGQEIEVSDAAAKQIGADHPGFFAIDGEVGKKRKQRRKSEDDSDGEQTDEISAQLMEATREDLNAAASELGIDEPAQLPNKQAVVEAIVAAQAAAADAT